VLSNTRLLHNLTLRVLSYNNKAGWDSIPIDNCNTSFKNTVMAKLNPKLLESNNNSSFHKSKRRVMEIIKLPPSILVCLPKEILEKSKFFRKGKKLITITNSNPGKLYT